MQEFTIVSSSSFDPSALATKLTEKSADGWSVVSIVSTGGDVTAFLSRSGSADAAAPVVETAAVAAAFTPAPAPEPVASEPAGWAVAPDPAPVAPIVEASPGYAPAAAYTPAPAAAPAAAAAAVPAGWYADPAGRFELRYWDGGTWTEHVSRAGQQYTDPPVA